MSFRGGRGGGRFGGRGGFFRRAKEEAFEIFPEIEGLETVKFSAAEIKKDFKFVSMSQNLQSFFETSPYYYEDKSQTLNKVEKVDIERYSDKKSQATLVKPPLWHFINMGPDHMPAELARGEKRVAKKVRWDNESELNKFDVFEKLEKRHEGQEGAEKKENEEEEEDEEDAAGEEDEGEFSDEGDYEQAEYFDDDEDDFNMAEDNGMLGLAHAFRSSTSSVHFSLFGIPRPNFLFPLTYNYEFVMFADEPEY